MRKILFSIKDTEIRISSINDIAESVKMNDLQLEGTRLAKNNEIANRKMVLLIRQKYKKQKDNNRYINEKHFVYIIVIKPFINISI